jgi:hypothetical protein
VQTVEPLSQRRAVPIELVDALRVDAPVGRLRELVTDPRLETAVLCGHSEQVGGLVRQLADDGLLVDAPLVWPKGSTWVLDTSQDWVVGAAAARGPRRPPSEFALAGGGLLGRVVLCWQSYLVAMPGPASARAPSLEGKGRILCYLQPVMSRMTPWPVMLCCTLT